MTELGSLYREVILDHAKCPRFKQTLDACNFCQEGKNPLCGDMITVYCQVKTANNAPEISVCFDGQGCFISQASASIMCESLQSVSLATAKQLIAQAEDVYTGKAKPNDSDLENDLDALYGVSQFPVRIKCAALAWKALELLLNDNFDTQGQPKAGCDNSANCVKSPVTQRKLKIVSTEI